VTKFSYTLGGATIGFEYEYVWGTFKPDFGGGFVVQYADADTAKNLGLPVDSPGWKSAWAAGTPSGQGPLAAAHQGVHEDHLLAMGVR
jgi:hypothetical protein